MKNVIFILFLSVINGINAQVEDSTITSQIDDFVSSASKINFKEIKTWAIQNTKEDLLNFKNFNVVKDSTFEIYSYLLIDTSNLISRNLLYNLKEYINDLGIKVSFLKENHIVGGKIIAERVLMTTKISGIYTTEEFKSYFDIKIDDVKAIESCSNLLIKKDSKATITDEYSKKYSIKLISPLGQQLLFQQMNGGDEVNFGNLISNKGLYFIYIRNLETNATCSEKFLNM